MFLKGWHSTNLLIGFLVFAGLAYSQSGALANGGVVTGHIATTTQIDSYTIFAPSGAAIMAGVSEVGSNTTFHPQVKLLTPSGSSAGYSSGDLYTYLMWHAEATGIYTIQVTRADLTSAGGNYSLTVAVSGQPFSVPEGHAGGNIIMGQNYTGSLSRAGIDIYTFQWNASDAFVIGLSEAGTNTTFRPAYWLLSPDGVTVGSNNQDLSSVDLIHPTVSPGIFYLMVYRGDTTDVTGNYTLTIGKGPGYFYTPPGDQGGPMLTGVPYSGTIFRGDVDQYSFYARNGDPVTINFYATSANTFQAGMWLISPTGVSLTYGTGNPAYPYEAHVQASGVYTILVYRWNGDTADDTGTYALEVTGNTGGSPPGIAKTQGSKSKCIPCQKVADPIKLGTGNLYEEATDYTTAGSNPLSFARYYNSLGTFVENSAVSLGPNWRSNFDRTLDLNSASSIQAERPDGRVVAFSLKGSVWTGDSDVDITLTDSGTTWTLTDDDDTVETYTTSGNKGILDTIKLRNGYTQTMHYTEGQLTSVSDSYGRSLVLTYTGSLLNKITTPDGLVLTYEFSSEEQNSVLTKVAYSTSPATSVSYHYEDASFPFALTGITDENGNRYATWAYDGQGRAISSQHAGGADLTAISYDDTTGNRTVTGPLGMVETYKFMTLQGAAKVSEIDRAANGTITAAVKKLTYDGNGYLASITDWNGNLTTYVNNIHGLPSKIVEASGTSVQRETDIVYDTAWPRQPHTITTPGLTTTYNYDTSTGNLLTKVLTDTTTTTSPYSTKGQSRATTYTYTSTGQIQSVRLPRTDVTAKTTYGYSGGALTSITDALNHVTHVTSATAGGYPEIIVDSNSDTTTLTYDARMRLLSSTLATAAGNLITSYTYNNAGDRTKVTLPDGSYLSYSYDEAHRLTSITNKLGESMPLTLDANGDLTETLSKNAASTTVRQHTATFDTLGRKLTDVGGVSQTTTYGYDSQGNLTSIKTPLTWATGQAFDQLNRLKTITDPYSHTTGYTYDAHDRPLSVTDPNGHATNYVYDGFGEAIQASSPDTGVTVYHYDTDGNVSSKTDAAGNVANYTYDAAERIKARSYPADSTLNVAYTYDQTGHGKGIGRLTSVTDQSGSLSLSYEERGLVTINARTIGSTVYTTTYTYDNASRVATIAYPTAGWKVTYTRDGAGQVSGVTATQPGYAAVNIATGVTHLPFGPMKSLIWGNGVTDARTFDADYRMTGLTDTGTAALQHLTYGYDADNNLHTITDAVTAANTQTLGYDHLERLISAASGAGGYGSLAYTYDNNGNRKSVGTTSYTIASTSNRLTAIGSTAVGYTATGNISSIGAGTMTYNKANQLATASASGASGTYGYDAFGQRLKVTIPGSPLQVYNYDQAGNLLTETDNNVEVDYVYLDGVPVAMIQPSTAAISYLHTDRLGTPQKATKASKALVWNAVYQPFGATVPSGSLTNQHLRLPGQYADNTGYFHNGFRDYNPAIGRYLESDPIGLMGGTNTYAYVGSNPYGWTDQLGLDPIRWPVTQDRSVMAGPVNGNWGGSCWSGGQISCGNQSIGTAAPTNSGDECAMTHDFCYASCESCTKGESFTECKESCDSVLLHCTGNLSWRSSQWLEPPQTDPNSSVLYYKVLAPVYFRTVDTVHNASRWIENNGNDVLKQIFSF